MVQMCKMIISPGAFFNVKILIFQFVKGLKVQKNGPKSWKFLPVASYISGIIYHMIFIYGIHVCIKGWYLQAFFSFFSKFRCSGSLGGKNKSLSRSVSQEPCIIWLWFLLHIFKMMISPAIVFFFKNFDFWGF